MSGSGDGSHTPRARQLDIENVLSEATRLHSIGTATPALSMDGRHAVDFQVPYARSEHVSPALAPLSHTYSRCSSRPEAYAGLERLTAHARSGDESEGEGVPALARLLANADRPHAHSLLSDVPRFSSTYVKDSGALLPYTRTLTSGQLAHMHGVRCLTDVVVVESPSTPASLPPRSSLLRRPRNPLPTNPADPGFRALRRLQGVAERCGSPSDGLVRLLPAAKTESVETNPSDNVRTPSRPGMRERLTRRVVSEGLDDISEVSSDSGPARNVRFAPVPGATMVDSVTEEPLDHGGDAMRTPPREVDPLATGPFARPPPALMDPTDPAVTRHKRGPRASLDYAGASIWTEAAAPASDAAAPTVVRKRETQPTIAQRRASRSSSLGEIPPVDVGDGHRAGADTGEAAADVDPLLQSMRRRADPLTAQKSIGMLERMSYNNLRRRYFYNMRGWVYVRQVQSFERERAQSFQGQDVAAAAMRQVSNPDPRAYGPNYLQNVQQRTKRAILLAQKQNECLSLRYMNLWMAWVVLRHMSATKIQAQVRRLKAHREVAALATSMELSPRRLGIHKRAPLRGRVGQRWAAAREIQRMVRGKQARAYVRDTLAPQFARTRLLQMFMRGVAAARGVAARYVEEAVTRAGAAHSSVRGCPRPDTAAWKVAPATAHREPLLHARFASGEAGCEPGRADVGGWYVMTPRVVNLRPVWANVHGVELFRVAQGAGWCWALHRGASGRVLFSAGANPAPTLPHETTGRWLRLVCDDTNESDPAAAAAPMGMPAGAACSSSIAFVPFDAWAVYTLQAVGRGFSQRHALERLRQDGRTVRLLESAGATRILGRYFSMLQGFVVGQREDRRLAMRRRRRAHVGQLQRRNMLIHLRQYRMWFQETDRCFRRRKFLAGSAARSLDMNRPIYQRYYNAFMRFIFEYRCNKLRKELEEVTRAECFHRLVRYRTRRKYYNRAREKVFLRYRKRLCGIYFRKLAVWAPVTAFCSYEAEHRAYIAGKEEEFAVALHVAHDRILENWVAYRDSLLRLSLRKMWEGNILRVMTRMWRRLADYTALKALCRSRRIIRGKEHEAERRRLRFLPKANSVLKAFMSAMAATEEQEARDRAAIENNFPQLKALHTQLFAGARSPPAGGVRMAMLDPKAQDHGAHGHVEAVEHPNVFKRSSRWETSAKWGRAEASIGRRRAMPPPGGGVGSSPLQRSSGRPASASTDSRAHPLSPSAVVPSVGSPHRGLSPGGCSAAGSPLVRMPAVNKRRAATLKEHIYTTGGLPNARRIASPEPRRRGPNGRPKTLAGLQYR